MTDFPSPRSRPDDLLGSDLEPGACRRATRQVVGILATSAVLIIAVVVYAIGAPTGVAEDQGGGVRLDHLVLGVTLGLALLLAGIGVVHRSRVLMQGTPIGASGSEDYDGDPQQNPDQRTTRGGFGRRRLIRNALLGALALLPLSAVWGLRRLDPEASTRRGHTAWTGGVRLLTDGGYRPIHASDVQVGEMVNVMPASFLELPSEGPDRQNERARSPVVLVRMRPDDLTPAAGRENWHVDGIVAYSKICTHVGCPVSLYERTTHHLLCPCHQATFDLANNGAVVFGPATRSLPQLPLSLDDDGFLIAQSDFPEAVGPSYWEREA